MIPIIISFLIPAASIGLIIFIMVRRKKQNKQQSDPTKLENYEQIPIWKALIYQLAPVAGFLVLFFYFVLKNEGVLNIPLWGGVIFFPLILFLWSLYKKVLFRFIKSELNFTGYKVVALKEIKSGKPKYRGFQLWRSKTGKEE